MRFTERVLVATVLMVTAAATVLAQPTTARITGTAAYRERVALQPGAVFEATLEDVSRADAPATVLATTRLEQIGAVPIAFEIPYDPKAIDESHTYAVRGRILVNGTLAFTTDTRYPVLTRGGGSAVDLLLVRVPSAPGDAPAQSPAGAAAQAARIETSRDAIGDMNADAIKQGDFPGSFLIPGPGGVSFGIGGFIKALAFHDTKAEGREAVFLPVLLGGIGRDDEDGTTSLTAELSRLNFDARATVGETKIRGYVEFDFSGDLFKFRHGYLSWKGAWGEVLAGKTWSTLMDLQSVPDGLGEPTVSGLIFTRQALFRYTRPLSKGVSVAVAIEDSASSDVQAAEPVLTRNAYPDLVASLGANGKAGHLQVAGVVRSLEFDPNNAPGDSATGYGVSVGAHVNLGARDRVYGQFSHGEGLGRYLVGIAPAAGAFIDVEARSITPRQNTGGLIGVRHQWSGACRSSLAYSYAQAENDPRQPPGAFRESSFTLGNLMCKANRFLTVGVEVDYGTRGNRDGSDRDNLRLMFGMQLF